jgi:DNA-binding NtrC family response regulator
MTPQLDSRPLLVGNSLRTRQIVHLVQKMSRGRWPVLVLGETGTGKEVVARSIYNANPVGPFVTIDCSSVVGPLMESELFGHVRGSFTGAVTAKNGLLELADGGTAFFDEIGELPLDLQSRLLRALQEKEFRAVGSNQIRRSDFRIIAATNRDLAREVEKGNFRRDLYYRLNVVSIRIAPLRERKDDIPALIAHFLQKYGSGHSLSADAMDAMLDYDWPGNVRELENAVQHMVALNSGAALQMHDLPSSIQNHRIISKIEARAMAASVSLSPLPAGREPCEAAVAVIDEPDPAGPPPPSPVLPLTEMERRAIVSALEYTRGDRAVAAHLLGIGRTTLYRKLKEYNLAV